jgi:hypothetical protein
MMVYNNQNHWIYGLCPSSTIIIVCVKRAGYLNFVCILQETPYLESHSCHISEHVLDTLILF